MKQQYQPSFVFSQQAKMYRFVTVVYEYNYHNSGHIHRPVLHLKIQLNSVSRRKHITSPLLAQQINVIYGFVTVVY
jgi:hypothetical protein